jgi:hypothetical protein
VEVSVVSGSSKRQFPENTTEDNQMKNYTDYHAQQLEKAIAYLRERKIYVLENSFKPTNAAQTDVTQTFARYRAQTQGQQIIREVRKYK